MKHCLAILIALSWITASRLATAAPDAKKSPHEAGMLIKGDQEAPLLLYILPWQEPMMPEVPDTDLQPVLPKVLDDDFGILRRSKNTGPIEVEK